MQFETHQPEHDHAASHWLAPVAMFVAWLAALLARIARLNRIRRITKFKSTWRDSWPGLRQSEWHRDLMLSQGAALLLSGETLDDADFVDHPMPADYGGPCPKSPYEMKRRFAVIADWLRDPEAHIRRHAARIAKRGAHGSTNTAICAAAHHEAVIAAQSSEDSLVLMANSDHRERRAGALANARAPPERY